MLTKAAIAAQLEAEGLVPSKKAGKEIVDRVFQSITDSMKKGEDVSIDKFATFKTVAVPEKSGKIPGTDKTYTKAAHNAPKIKASKALKDLLA